MVRARRRDGRRRAKRGRLVGEKESVGRKSLNIHTHGRRTWEQRTALS